MDAVDPEHGGWVVEIAFKLPYTAIAETGYGEKVLKQTFVIFVPFGDEPSAVQGMSDLSLSVRFLPGQTVEGEVVSDAGSVPEGRRVLALPGAVERGSEEVGG